MSGQICECITISFCLLFYDYIVFVLDCNKPTLIGIDEKRKELTSLIFAKSYDSPVILQIFLYIENIFDTKPVQKRASFTLSPKILFLSVGGGERLFETFPKNHPFL